MASVLIRPTTGMGGDPTYRATFSRMGRGLVRRPQMSSQEMTTPRLGPPAVFPTGTDTRTPGFPLSRRKSTGSVYGLR